jgi:hypothetical protein
MDVELKTGGMARMPVGYDANTKRGRKCEVGIEKFERISKYVSISGM